jgi:D-lactate dehydrogenase (cytochrome)
MEIRSTLHDTENAISTNDADLRAHGYSETSYVQVDVLPVAVTYPRNTE